MVKNKTKAAVATFIENEKAFYDSLKKITALESDLGCVDGKIIGTGQPDYTQGSTEYKLVVDNKDFLLIDIPGIEGKEKEYKKIILNSLEKAHLIFYVNGSGKKAEKKTLERIKAYMHDGTSVYALFNVHCKAKKKRVPGIDKSYTEELAEAYKVQGEIAAQTEAEFKPFLGENFKGSVLLNGLLSFCSLAADGDGSTTIVNDEEKTLRNDQVKLLKEYSGDFEQMRRESHIELVEDVIARHIEHFDEYIIEENLKKLRVRLADTVSKVESLKKIESEKIKNFLSDYDDFERHCKNAKYDFTHTIQRIGRTEVESAFIGVREELFDAVEKNGGKIKKEQISEIFDKRKNKITKDIEKAVSDKVNEAAHDYQSAVKEAEKRLLKDLQREQKKFKIAMQANALNLDTSFLNALKFSFKDFTDGAMKIGRYIWDMTIAIPIPIIGSIVGLLVGLFDVIWGWIISKEKRINRAKAKLQEALNDKIDEIVDEIKKSIKKHKPEEQIKRAHTEIQNGIERQRATLRDIEKLLDVVTLNLNKSAKALDR